MKTFHYLLAGLISLVLPVTIQAAEAPDIVSECAACHVLEKPESQTLGDRMTRKAPPLYYAGNKFREEWLVSWLQDPVRIRPAGDYPPAHSSTVDEKDVINTETLIEHPVVEEDQAIQSAAWLMTLTPFPELIAVDAEYTPGNVNPRLGTMDFVKFKGCGACHQDDPEYGGFSGPELYTAWNRLQPAYITSYIRNPLAWEPYSLMPNKELQDAQIHKLADYLKVVSELGE